MDEDKPVTRVTGLGGIFFKANDPAALQAWYNTHLGLPLEADGVGIFRWREWGDPAQAGSTVWAAFAADTQYFAPSAAPFMLNYRVADLDAVLAALRAEGVPVMDEIEESEFGRFGWIMDPEGNKIELWQPPAGH